MEGPSDHSPPCWLFEKAVSSHRGIPGMSVPQTWVWVLDIPIHLPDVWPLVIHLTSQNLCYCENQRRCFTATQSIFFCHLYACGSPHRVQSLWLLGWPRWLRCHISCRLKPGFISHLPLQLCHDACAYHARGNEKNQGPFEWIYFLV